jgi:hypothetical protein
LPSGRELLSEVAKLSKGRERTDIVSVLADPPRSRQTRTLLPWLFAASLIVLLLEIAGRRLSWWETFPWWRRSTAAIEPEEIAIPRRQTTPTWWESLRLARTRSRSVSSVAANRNTKTPDDPLPVPKPQAPAPKPVSAADLFEQAKKRASHRLK